MASPGAVCSGTSRLGYSWIRWIYVLVLWISLCVDSGSGLYGHDRADYYGECAKFLYSSTVEPKLNRLLELHIRLNFRGFVEIRDGDYKSSKIRIEIEKTGPSEFELENISINETTFDVGRGSIFVLQLDHVKTRSRTVTIVIGAAIAGAIFLTLTSLLVWWYYRRRNQPFSPMHGHGLTASTDGRDSTYDEELIESTVTTPVHRVNGGTQGTQSCPPPPPPCRGDPTYMSTAEARAAHTPLASGQSSVGSSQTPLGSGQTPLGSPRHMTTTGVGSPRGVSKTAMVALSVVTVVSVVYAACPFDAQARIIIIIPPAVKLESINIFFNKHFQNELYDEGWKHRNSSKVLVFDLEDASPTPNMPCKGNCPSAYIQNLAGCDAATGECICQHGYAMLGGACTDIDECSEQHFCPATATCQNKVGGYKCQCGYGFYGDRKTCKLCSKGCPAGYFEESPCVNWEDLRCKECTKCTGAQYEARPCGETVDRQCMHVAHPLKIAGDDTTPVFLEGLKVESSDNVFMEDLHNIRNLETMYYVTDTTQAFDFEWLRDSGLKVNIGVLKIHLIPEYEDVEHESDNNYMLNNPNNSEDKTKFNKIVNKQCRNPIPDYYSVTLEISRDRTTMAEDVTCNNEDAAKTKCPDEYVNGDTYLHRTLNEACPKMNKGTFPEELVPAANSIVCTDNTRLLREIFNQSYTIQRPIKFPPNRCRVAQARCDQCLEQPRCKALVADIFAQKCCQIDCYTLPDCKLAQSDECTTAPVECAMGDAYRYTIQPVYQNIRQHYMCHIKRKEPQILYQIFFSVLIRDFQTPQVYKTIYARDLDYQSVGEYKADYITVEHNTGLKLDEEFILIGQEKSPDGQYNYSIHSLKEPDDYRKKRVVVHEISPNIYVASTQFERPFDYSTSSWVKNNECHKNISKFQKVQRHYGSEGQAVNVMTHGSPNKPFNYFLKSTDPDPFIRFKVPGNMSILPYYFQDDGPELVTGESLRAELHLTSGHRIWEIRVSGYMTDCPGYLGITINNRLDLEEIFRYDLLILCPAEFNLTFKIPNWGQDPDKTFDVQLKDAKQTYDVYLTQMIFEQLRVETEAEAITMPQPPQISLTLFSVVGAVTVLLLVIMLAVYIYTEQTKPQPVYDGPIKTRTAYDTASVTAAHTSRSSEVLDGDASCKGLDQRQTVFIGIYIFMRVVYSLMCTFTVFFAILMIFLDKDLTQLSKLDTYQGEKYNSTMMLGNRIDEYSQNELLRQSELITSMQGACSHYIGELFDSMAKEMDNITANQHQLDMYGSDSSISYLMSRRARQVMDGFSDELENFTKTYQDQVRLSVKPFLTRYKRYLQKIFNDDWYTFSQKLFNDSEAALSRPRYIRNSPEFHGPEIDFGVFLEIEEVENIQLWDIQFWENYMNTIPDLESLPVPKVDHQAPMCTLSNPVTMATTSLSNRTSLDHLSSAQFVSTHLPEEPVKGPKYKSTHYAEEYKFVAHNSMQPSESVVFSIDEFISYINIDLLRIIFLILDGLLLIYRFSHTYIATTTLCHGFEDSVARKDSEGKEAGAAHAPSIAAQSSPAQASQQTYATLTSRSSHYPEEAPYVETSLPDYSAPLNGQRSAYLHPVTQSTRTHDPAYAQTNKYPDYLPKDHNFESLRQSVVSLVLSETVPKVLVATAMMLLFYLFVRAVTVYLDVMVISQLEGFSVFLGALDIQLNQTNWYLLDQAGHFNDVTMKIYESQMTSELLNLKSMVDYFNSEQHRIVYNYISEACAITRLGHLNWTCEVDMSPPALQIPMLPCNFIPIQPDVYTAFNSEKYESQLGRSFDPYVSAARQVILTSGYAILIVVAAMLVIHIGGAVLFHFLKTRHKFPVRRVFISSSPPSAPRGIQNPVHGGEESEYDSDDHDGARGGHYATYATPTRVRMSPQKTNTLTTDFKYSETKV